MVLAAPRCENSQHFAACDALRDRVKELLDAEIDFIDNASFRDAHAEEEILTPEPACEEGDSTSTSKRGELPAHLARLCDAALLSADEERRLFRRMNYLKFRANALRWQLDFDDPQAEQIAQLEQFLDEAAAVRDRIIRANMRLVISIVKKFVSPSFSFDELLSDGIMTLMNAVEKFDYDRGYRFSTYAYRSIARNAYRKVMDRKKEMSKHSMIAEGAIEGSLEDRGTASMDEKTWERLRNLLGGFLDRLDKRERMIVQARYALGKHRNVQTFQSIADKLGVSKERVRQLEQRAVGKLRNMAAESQTDPTL